MPTIYVRAPAKGEDRAHTVAAPRAMHGKACCALDLAAGCSAAGSYAQAVLCCAEEASGQALVCWPTNLLLARKQEVAPVAHPIQSLALLLRGCRRKPCAGAPMDRQAPGSGQWCPQRTRAQPVMWAPKALGRARRHRAARLCCEVTADLAKASGGTPAFEGPAWNGRTVDLIRLAKAHCALVLHRTFAASVRRLADEVRLGRRGRRWHSLCARGATFRVSHLRLAFAQSGVTMKTLQGQLLQVELRYPLAAQTVCLRR